MKFALIALLSLVSYSAHAKSTVAEVLEAAAGQVRDATESIAEKLANPKSSKAALCYETGSLVALSQVQSMRLFDYFDTTSGGVPVPGSNPADEKAVEFATALTKFFHG